ncbi:MAG: helix-turn-helix transcriptional regulator [bacterium]|nr:helix-turn-helix transcriptional regulator [bacterium]
MPLSDKIRLLRKERNLTQEKLGDLVGVHTVHIGKYETGKSSPSSETLKNLASVFEVSIDYLMFDDAKNMASTKITDQRLLYLFEEIDSFPAEEKEHIKYILEAIVRDRKYSQVSKS